MRADLFFFLWDGWWRTEPRAAYRQLGLGPGRDPKDNNRVEEGGKSKETQQFKKRKEAFHQDTGGTGGDEGGMGGEVGG